MAANGMTACPLSGQVVFYGLFTGDAITIAIKSIDIYASYSNWTSNILRAITTTASTIHITRVWNAA